MVTEPVPSQKSSTVLSLIDGTVLIVIVAVLGVAIVQPCSDWAVTVSVYVPATRPAVFTSM